MKRIKQVAVYSFCTLLVAFTSCDMTHPKEKESQYSNYDIIEMDGCEYYRSTSGRALTHKGNCKNPVHNCN